MLSYLELVKQSIKCVSIPKTFSLSGPKKISKKDNCAFSLPAGLEFSCPGATEACKKCYAQKSRHLWSPVQKAFARNWKLIRHFERHGKDKEAALHLIHLIPKNIGNFRIFESGDFVSPWVVGLWANVVKQRQDVNFWAYTRSFDLDFTPLTRNKNFTLWASTDDFNIQKAKQFVRRFKKSGTKHAYGPWPHDRDIPKNSVICPTTSGRLKMQGACEKCKLCIIKKRINKNIVFLAH
ncbi:hypothetical protein LCGC14_1774330 [marine sediment metagenome]|uniref:Gene product 88 domain-containing protein n=1 Tax=marine sediment metagenome TaxID=412755 RepID=A0A0F9JC90_9ZZZZ